MRRLLIIMGVAILLMACSPVLNRGLMKEGIRDVQFDQLREAPDDSKGRLYILGGIIVDTRLTETGSQIEALFVPVDSYGYLKEGGYEQGRFLALYPKSRGILDPIVYKDGREITLAGEFIEVKTSKVDELEYAYPVFEIREIHLWGEYESYYPAPYYYPYYPSYYDAPFLYDPWGRPYPNPYWPPPPW